MRWRSVWRWLAGGFAAAVLLLGLATGLFRLLVPTLPQYEHEIEAWASDALKVPFCPGYERNGRRNSAPSDDAGSLKCGPRSFPLPARARRSRRQ